MLCMCACSACLPYLCDRCLIGSGPLSNTRLCNRQKIRVHAHVDRRWHRSARFGSATSPRTLQLGEAKHQASVLVSSTGKIHCAPLHSCSCRARAHCFGQLLRLLASSQAHNPFPYISQYSVASLIHASTFSRLRYRFPSGSHSRDMAKCF